jgi:hypothetical protein
MQSIQIDNWMIGCAKQLSGVNFFLDSIKMQCLKAISIVEVSRYVWIEVTLNWLAKHFYFNNN